MCEFLAQLFVFVAQLADFLLVGVLVRLDEVDVRLAVVFYIIDHREMIDFCIHRAIQLQYLRNARMRSRSSSICWTRATLALSPNFDMAEE